MLGSQRFEAEAGALERRGDLELIGHERSGHVITVTPSDVARPRITRTAAPQAVRYLEIMGFDHMAAVFPVSDIDLAMAHYRQLGFVVRRDDGPDGYAFAERDGIEIHLARVDDLIPERNLTAIYLYVDDADALYDEWNGAGIDGRVVAPSDTSYGLGEGACLDRDANLIRFGSPI